jgi:hypothetical protein
VSEVVVTDPTGIVDPDWIGQMFYDPVNTVFYQARGRTSADWRFVPPADFVGSFVKVYDHFYGLPEDDPKDAEAANRWADAKVVRETMAKSGVEVLGLGGLRWRTANGTDVFQVRLRFHKVDGFILFAGFTGEARAYAMPEGVGFELSNGFLRFGGNAREVAPGEIIVLRIEERKDNIYECNMMATVNDEGLGAVKAEALPSIPVVALFDVGPGARQVAVGYENALKRNVERA